MNKIKYMIPFLTLVLLIPVGMSNTFAQSGPGEATSNDIGPVGVVEEHTAESHKLRIDAKKQNIENLKNEMTIVAKRIFELEATLTELNSKGIADKQHNVKASLDELYIELDVLQEKAYEYFEIPEKRYQKLLDIKEEILVQYKDTTLLNDVFIDHFDESVQVILHSNDFELYKNSVLDTTGSITSDKFEDSAGEIAIGVKHFTASTVTGGDLMCSEFSSLQSERSQTCEHATIAFPATKGSDNGFVTVGHAFGRFLPSTAAGAPTYQAKVYQPGPESDNIGSATVPTGQSLSDLSWQAQVIGKLTYGIYKDSNSIDAAFVKLLPGKTIDRKISHYGIDYDIAGYNTGNPVIGHYVYQTGAATGTTFGFIRSVDMGIVRASYNECVGDSGAPVGTVSRGEFTVYGMHLGLAAEEVPGDDDAQTASCATRGDKYSRFITYDKIVTLLPNIRGLS